ncbi:hypothetical protein EVAR_31892_1 [Eumeta japonica]|uniref:Uncharacterized protein n=1 Tax=Eumeta variegata TaxID=151549 RepID=A0A4C1WXI6_EUMVA|nr:hypothetical protein EVAR_31892_1 [Eumeta japonica]
MSALYKIKRSGNNRPNKKNRPLWYPPPPRVAADREQWDTERLSLRTSTDIDLTNNCQTISQLSCRNNVSKSQEKSNRTSIVPILHPEPLEYCYKCLSELSELSEQE